MRIDQITAWDTETFLITQQNPVPQMVCLSYARHDESGVLHARDQKCKRRFCWMIDECLSSDGYMVGHNVAYDLAVVAQEYPEYWPLIWRMYDEERVLDTMLRQKLIDIAKGEYRRHGEYTLENLSRRHAHPKELDKDTWRLKYGELYNTPIDMWPQDAIEYPRHDALATLFVCVSQMDDERYLEDQHRQARAAWALHLISAWGIRTDRVMVERHRNNTLRRMADVESLLLKHDLIYKDKRGEWHKRAKKAAEMCARAWKASGFDEIPRDFLTDGGAPSLSEDAADALKDPVISAYQMFASAATVMNRVDELEQGIWLPIHTRFDSIMETGRTSSQKPNIQNRAVEPGDRECFVARKGHCLLDTDIDGLELRTISQSLIYAGIKPKLASVLNANGDPHCVVGAQLLGISYEEALRRKEDPNDTAMFLARQSGKIANFGLNAGLGWGSLIVQARQKYGVTLTEQSAKELIAAWHGAYPEFKEFFSWVRSLCAGGNAWIQHFTSNRYRGDIPYTVTCNTFSQGLGADAMKHVMYHLVKECYIGSGPLRGSRVVNFIHDQFLTEVPEGGVNDIAPTYEKLITDRTNEWLPDVKTKAKAIATRRWSKLAKRKVDEKGRLIIWEWEEAKKAGSTGYAE